MIKFAQGTPAAVRDWLQSLAETPQRFVSRPVRSPSRQSAARPAKVEVRPDHPIAKALATNERMESVWRLIGDWPGALHLVQLAVHYTSPLMLWNLEAPPEQRTAFGFASSWLAAAAEDFVLVLDDFPETAADLWGEPVGGLMQRLRAFARAGSRNQQNIGHFTISCPRQAARDTATCINSFSATQWHGG